MTFLPKVEVLSLEELDQIASAFVALGVKKLRITGGEPLVRKGMIGLIAGLGPASEVRRARRDHADHQRHAPGGVRGALGRRPAFGGSMFRWIR